MPNFSKILITLLAFFVLAVYSLSILIDDSIYMKKTDSLASIKTATMLATYNIIDVKNANATYDGSRREPNDVPIDFSSKDYFVKILSSFSDVKMQDMKVIGFVSYKYVTAVTIRGEKLTPAMYWWRNETDDGGMTPLFEFCLGNNVYVDNVLYVIDEANPQRMVEYVDSKNPKMVQDPADVTGETWIEVEPSVIESSSYGFVTAVQWRNYAIQKTIASYINNLASMADSNIEVYMSHQLDQEDVANIIEGPSVFSIVDINGERIILLGGAEMKLSNVTKSGQGVGTPAPAPVSTFNEFMALVVDDGGTVDSTEDEQQSDVIWK